jgi:hypothetical protein
MNGTGLSHIGGTPQGAWLAGFFLASADGSPARSPNECNPEGDGVCEPSVSAEHHDDPKHNQQREQSEAGVVISVIHDF